MRRTVALISLAVTFGVTSSATAATTFQINGGGDGHGIGMSQYGAYGYALHGESYQFILGHYYQGTTLGSTDPNQVVSVLLATGRQQFSGASSAGGHKLNPNLTYSVRALANGDLLLSNQSGKKVAQVVDPLSASGPGPLDLAGHGQYRGALQFSVVGGAVQTVDVVGLDDYVRGVIAAEMPSSWPAAALEAQAVAARTYAITSNVGGNGFTLYPDTRSQMYGGVAAETSATDAAVAATRGQIVTYLGLPATTYFFSSSGGQTENIENVWLSAAPEPWLKGVSDPYDGAGGDPYHHWAYQMTLAAAQKKLGGLVRGRLRGIRVTKRGVSPRIVDAQVVGTRGTTSVTGPQLQNLFGLMSTYMRFTTVSAATTHRHGAVPRAAEDHPTRALLQSARFALPQALEGWIFPAAKGSTVEVQVHTPTRWRTVRRVALAAGGGYSVSLSEPGTYRVLYGQVAGPEVTVG